MHICCVQITEPLKDSVFKEMVQYISFEKRNKINRFRKPIDATRSLLGDLVIRFMLCKYYGFQNNEIIYGFHEFGKPYLLQQSHLHFNISHSGDWVVGVISTDLIGIDIEKIIPVRKNIPLMILSNQEKKKFQELDGIDRNEFFFELWTLKESYVKMIGKGLYEKLNTLNVIHNNTISIEKKGKPTKAYLETLDCINGYKFCLCSFSMNYHKKLSLFSFNEFSKQFRMAFSEKALKL